MNHTFLVFFILLVTTSSCQQSMNPSSAPVSPDTTFHAVTLPEIPVMLTSAEQHADFLAKHYWDNARFTDTSYVSHKEAIEQAWVDYLDIQARVPLKTSSMAISGFFTQISGDRKLFTHFTGLADKYLYDPNSPLRNEEMYIPVLEAMLTSPVLNETEKLRTQDRLMMANKNRVGTKAQDFTYILSNGSKGTLHGISTEYTVLFINNPGCHACSQMIAEFKSVPRVNELLKDKYLTILSVYPDEELDEWKRHQSEFSSDWINGYDKTLTIKNKNLYDLKAIPTLYLLDNSKTVLLKDAPLLAIEAWLMQNTNQ